MLSDAGMANRQGASTCALRKSAHPPVSTLVWLGCMKRAVLVEVAAWFGTKTETGERAAVRKSGSCHVGVSTRVYETE